LTKVDIFYKFFSETTSVLPYHITLKMNTALVATGKNSPKFTNQWLVDLLKDESGVWEKLQTEEEKLQLLVRLYYKLRRFF